MAEGKRPPNSTSWRHGQSGNPKGAPKKQKAPPKMSFDVLFGQRHTVKVGGVEREFTTDEALQHRIMQDAFAGKAMAEKAVLKWIAKRDAAAAKAAPAPNFNIPTQLEVIPDDINEALVLLGIATEVPGPSYDNKFRHYELNTALVQLALSRRTGPRLSEQACDTVKRFTRNAGLLRWPRERSR